jgi:hypothetical protein
MSYTPLGWTGTAKISTPWGSKNFSATIPIEQAVDYAMNRAESRMQAALPGLMDQALARAGGYVTGELWPQMQPKLRIEVDRAVRKGELVAEEAVDTATQRAAMLGGVLIVAIAGAAWWMSRKRG